MCGQFCPNLRGWEVSEIIQFHSCRAQQLGTEEKPRQVLLLWQLWVTLGLPGKEQENPPLLAALPVAFLLSSWLVSQEAAQHWPSALSQLPVWSTWKVGNSHDSSAKFFPALRKFFFFSSRFWTWDRLSWTRNPNFCPTYLIGSQ